MFQPGDEDIHTAVERRVTEIAGDVGRPLHTGRSRNDQVATDLRLFAKRELLVVARRVLGLQAGPARPGPGGRGRLPARLHPPAAGPAGAAGPPPAGPRLGARPRRRPAARHPAAASTSRRSAPARWPARRCRSIPTGVAAELGFAAAFENSLDAVSDRDFVAEALFDLALIGVHLSRHRARRSCCGRARSSASCSWPTPTPPAARCCRRRRTPTSPSWPGARPGRLIGHLTGLLATLKGLPLAYNRDLQEDKEPLFDAARPGRRWALAAMTGLLATATWDTERMQAAADTPYVAAVDLAEWLVERGMPFREAHAVVGGLVRDVARAPRAAGRAGRGPPGPRAPRPWSCWRPGVAVTRRTTPGRGRPGAGGGAARSGSAARLAGRAAATWTRPERCPDPWPSEGACAARAWRSDRPDVARRWRRACSTSCWSPRTAGPAASSRWRPTTAPQDPASHAFRGPTAAQRGHVRAARPPLRVLQLRGALVRQRGLRARRRGAGGPAAGPRTGGRPGADAPARWRGQRRQDDRDLCRGPGRLCQALGIDRSFDGVDLTAARRRSGWPTTGWRLRRRRSPPAGSGSRWRPTGRGASSSMGTGTWVGIRRPRRRRQPGRGAGAGAGSESAATGQAAASQVGTANRAGSAARAGSGRRSESGTTGTRAGAGRAYRPRRVGCTRGHRLHRILVPFTSYSWFRYQKSSPGHPPVADLSAVTWADWFTSSPRRTRIRQALDTVHPGG